MPPRDYPRRLPGPCESLLSKFHENGFHQNLNFGVTPRPKANPFSGAPTRPSLGGEEKGVLGFPRGPGVSRQRTPVCRMPPCVRGMRKRKGKHGKEQEKARPPASPASQPAQPSPASQAQPAQASPGQPSPASPATPAAQPAQFRQWSPAKPSPPERPCVGCLHAAVACPKEGERKTKARTPSQPAKPAQ